MQLLKEVENLKVQKKIAEVRDKGSLNGNKGLQKVYLK